MKEIWFLMPCLWLLSSLMSLAHAQVTAEYLLVESLDPSTGCGRNTDCQNDRFCLDLYMKFDSAVNISGYNIFFVYDNTVMRRGTTTPSADGSDNACLLMDAGDTDFDTSDIISAYRVGAIDLSSGQPIPSADSFILIHNFCWGIIDQAAFNSGTQQVVVGVDVFGIANVMGLSTGTIGVDFTSVAVTNVPDTFTINQSNVSCLQGGSCDGDANQICPTSIGDGKVYVDVNATGSGDGSSWQDAYSDLQDALDCPCADTILLAQGTYHPASSPDDASTDLRDYAFHVDRSVVIRGGFDPATGVQDLGSLQTIISGDIGQSGDHTDDAHHLIIMYGGSLSIEGVALEGGKADGVGDVLFAGQNIDRSKGGGIYAIESDIYLSHTAFSNHTSSSDGAAIWTSESLDIDIRNSDFHDNHAQGRGGVLYAAPGLNILTVHMQGVHMVDNMSFPMSNTWFDSSDLGLVELHMLDCTVE